MNKNKILAAAILVTIVLLISLHVIKPSACLTGGGTEEYNRPGIAYMTGTHYNDIITLPSAPNTTVDIPTGWTITQTNISIIDLVESGDFIVNGSFDTGSGTSSPPWSYREYDPGNVASGSWVNGQPLTGNKCVYAQIPASSGGTTFQKGTKGYWQANFIVNKGTVINAILDLWYYADFASNFDRGEFQAYVAVEGHTVWARGFNEIADAGQRNTWVHLTINILSDTNGEPVFNLPTDQNITVAVGVRYTSGTATYSGWNSNNRVYYDNISIVLTAQVKADQLNLTVTDPNSTNHILTSTDFGVASCSFTGVYGPFTAPVFEHAVYTYSYNSSNQVSFKNNITVTVIKPFNSSSVTYSVENGSNVSWLVKFYTHLSFNNEPKGSGPTFYTNYYFNLTFPLDWNISKIIDPYGYEHTANESNYILYSNSSVKILFVNVSAIGLYGFYSFEAVSPNYIRSIYLQVYKTGSGWVNGSFFKAGDVIRFVAVLSDENGNPPTVPGNASIIVKDPRWFSWPETGLNVSVIGRLAITDNITAPTSILVGAYLVEFQWSNGYEVGFLKNAQIGVQGSALVSVKHPIGQEAYILSGSSLLIEVELSDPVTSQPITDALVEYRFSWEPPNTWHQTQAIGNRYIATALVPEPQVGEHTIIIRVNHTFYAFTATTTVKINVWQEWYIYLPWGGRILGWLFISYAAFAALIAAGGFAAWNYYFKYPKIIRKIRGMIKTIRSGRLPKPTGVRDRDIILEGLKASTIAPALNIQITEEPSLTVETPAEPSLIEETKPPAAEDSLKKPAVEESVEIKEAVKSVPEIVEPEMEYYAEELRKIESLTDEEVKQILNEMKDLSEDERKTMLETLKESYSSKE
ncbi:MAG: hypothetical protein OdinLCB4_001185 [Candidatus Odinarchaeum yellowstonii]|uniref:Uncharacterized protein n=1 Tax=Odinarchaeota yellowstonii (strain LCB_4) TaxID=1841599 RepID=A0AAF0D2P2_ODILC|nr:MAG: hypothetical protein OdinLCB4_001185 [Candidatus Odinarchaeum yellowstonii]